MMFNEIYKDKILGSMNLATLMAYLEVKKKRRGSKVEGGRVIQLLCLKVF